MKELLKILRCPRCKYEKLFQIKESLRCTHCNANFKVIDGIPILTTEYTSDVYYEDHWKKYGGIISQTKLKIANDFLKFINIDMNSKDDISILDIGCGNGIHALALKKLGFNSHYIGLDLSINALKWAKKISDIEDVIVADAINLPFVDSCFELIIAYGVFACTKDWRQSLREAIRVLKPTGKIGIMIFMNKNINTKIMNILRQLCKIKMFSIIIPYILIPSLLIVKNESNISPIHNSIQECLEIIKTNLFPESLVFPEANDVYKLSHELGCKITSKRNWLLLQRVR